MNIAFYIALGVSLGLLLIIAIIVFIVKRKKEDKNPLSSRAEDLLVMINQRILSLNSRIQKLDTEVTALLIAKENEDLTVLDISISFDDIPEKINTNKEEINTFIADIKDLRDYKEEIETVLAMKGEKDWVKLEELLDFVKEKFQYRYI